MRNNIGLFLAKRAELSPALEAVVEVERDRRFSFAELNRRVNRTANSFVSLGVGKGDRIALLSTNSVEFLETFFGAAKIGAIVVPLNWRLAPREIAFILADAAASVLLYDAAFSPAIPEIRKSNSDLRVRCWVRIGEGGPESSDYDYLDLQNASSDAEPTISATDDDVLYLMYTSGTTGTPKGVIHTHTTALWATLTVAATSETRFKDRALVIMPLFHVGGLSAVTGYIYRGITSIVLRAFDPRGVWQVIKRERATIMSAVPTMLEALLGAYDDQVDHSSLRWCAVGASPVPVPLIRAYEEKGIALQQVYGLTESCGPACLLLPDDAVARAGSTGKAFFHTSVRVVHTDGRDVAPGEIGEIIVSGPHIMRGYWNQPDETARAIRGGWLHTGDAATIDEAGFIYIKDRLKDMIISGGENIFPAEIEAVLRSHPQIADVAVIGQSSARWGETPLAVVVRRAPDLTAESVISFCKGQIANFKVPKAVEFVPEIPRNASGKALKWALRAQFPGPAAAGAPDKTQ